MFSRHVDFANVMDPILPSPVVCSGFDIIKGSSKVSPNILFEESDSATPVQMRSAQLEGTRVIIGITLIRT